MAKSILFFSRVSLSKFTLEALNISWVEGVFILEWERNAKSQFFHNIVNWRLGLATWLSHESKPRANWMAKLDFLSCSATASVTVQLLYILHSCASSGGLQATSHPRVLASLHSFEYFFTLSHALPLHDSHLNTGLLIAKLQENLAQNKANKMVD